MFSSKNRCAVQAMFLPKPLLTPIPPYPPRRSRRSRQLRILAPATNARGCCRANPPQMAWRSDSERAASSLKAMTPGRFRLKNMIRLSHSRALHHASALSSPEPAGQLFSLFPAATWWPPRVVPERSIRLRATRPSRATSRRAVPWQVAATAPTPAITGRQVGCGHRRARGARRGLTAA